MKFTFRISFLLKKSVVRKNDKSPITLNREKSEFSTQLSIEASKWNIETAEAKESNDESISINNDLNSIWMTIYHYY